MRECCCGGKKRKKITKLHRENTPIEKKKKKKLLQQSGECLSDLPNNKNDNSEREWFSHDERDPPEDEGVNGLHFDVSIGRI